MKKVCFSNSVFKFSFGQCPCLSLLGLNYKLKMNLFRVIESELGRHTITDQC